jgi:bifunctional DNA-binding transcriptional regulator/antitoxin component of YhaV-PrlF toxin-antitoxin module
MANKSVLQYPNSKQYIVTVPKGLVLAKGWKKGDKIEFVIDKSGNIVMRKKK